MQYHLSRSGNSETDHPSAEQNSGIPEKKEGEQKKPNSSNVVTKLYAVAVLTCVLMGATLDTAAVCPAPTGIKNVVLVHGAFADGSGWNAVAKILEKDGYMTEAGLVVFTLAGRIEAADLAELQQLLGLEEGARHIALDLQDVTLVNRDAVKFLARCEAGGIGLENCPAYIREWIVQEEKRE